MKHKTFTKMKIFRNLAIGLTSASLFLMSCSTIIGGSKYNAHIVVQDRPNAKIYHNGEVKGTGSATIPIFRKDANKFTFTVKEDGCEEQQFNYTSRTFRGWAFVGTILSFTGLIEGIPIPWGVVIDLSLGSVWKPNVNEKGITKDDYKNFKYKVNYTSCKKSEPNNSGSDIIYLKNGSIIRGLIIEQIPNTSIKIQTKDGNIFNFKIDEIEKISKELIK